MAGLLDLWRMCSGSGRWSTSKTRVCHPSCWSRLNRAGGDIDHQRHQSCIEYKRNDAVRGRGAADGPVGDSYIGDLRGDPDHEREIDEIPVVGVVVLVATRKLQSARLGAALVIVGIMQGERGLHRGPRKRHGHG